MFDVIVTVGYNNEDGAIIYENVFYVSQQFTDFGQCLSEYIRFDPESHWTGYTVITVLHETMTYSNNADICYPTELQNGFIYYNEDTINTTLGITIDELEACLFELFDV